MLNNKLPSPSSNNNDNIFDLAKACDPSSFIKTESPEILSVKSLIDIPNNLFIPIGGILTTVSLNFKLYAYKTNKPYTLSIPLGSDPEIMDKAKELADKYCETHPKEAYISSYYRWNLIPVKNIKILKNIIADQEKLAKYTSDLASINTYMTEDGYLSVASNETLPETVCRAKTLGMPFSIVSKLSSAGITEVNHHMAPINIVYTKQTVAGTYQTELSTVENPLTEDLLKYIVVPSFGTYEEIQNSPEFKAAIMKILNMIESGKSPVRFNAPSPTENTEQAQSTPSVGTSVAPTVADDQVIESSGAFI